MEACIMDGKTKSCGSVSGIKTVVNPISLARLVMEKTPHIYLAFEGAEAFAKEQVSLSFLSYSSWVERGVGAFFVWYLVFHLWCYFYHPPLCYTHLMSLLLIKNFSHNVHEKGWHLATLFCKCIRSELIFNCFLVLANKLLVFGSITAWLSLLRC